MSDLSEKVRTVLINEGVGNEGGIHGWRCFDKERYPEPCDCMDEIVSQIENLVEVEVRAAEQRAIAAMREPGRVRVLVEEAEQRGFHRGYRTAVDYWRTVSTRYGKRKYREGREDAARDVEALRNRWNGQHDVVQLTAAVAEARGKKS